MRVVRLWVGAVLVGAAIAGTAGVADASPVSPLRAGAPVADLVGSVGSVAKPMMATTLGIMSPQLVIVGNAVSRVAPSLSGLPPAIAAIVNAG